MTGAPRRLVRRKTAGRDPVIDGGGGGVAGASRRRLRAALDATEAGALLGRHAGQPTAHPGVGGRPRRAATRLDDNLPSRQVIGADRKTHPGEADATGAFRSSTASIGFGYMRRRRTSKAKHSSVTSLGRERDRPVPFSIRRNRWRTVFASTKNGPNTVASVAFAYAWLLTAMV
jgi:hypothetical protein